MAFLAFAFVGQMVTRYTRPSRTHLILVFALGALVSTWQVATDVYPAVPRYLGGGAGDLVQARLTEAGARIWAEICGGRYSSDQTTTGTAYLLYQNSESYVFRVRPLVKDGKRGEPSARIVKIAKNQVLATKVMNDNAYENCSLFNGRE
jgi:hypothetical protein